MSKITAVYRMIVFENGQIELNSMPMDYIFDPLDFEDIQITTLPISDKLSQICAVIQNTKELLTTEGDIASIEFLTFRQMISKAIKNVSSSLNITDQTVSDKVTRQLGIKKDDFVELVFNFFKSNYNETTFEKSDLYKKVELYSTNRDLRYLHSVFKDLLFTS